MSNDLLPLDQGIGEIIEASSFDDLIKREPVCFQQPQCHVPLLILYCQSQAVIFVLVFNQWITAMFAHEVFNDFDVASISCKMNWLTFAYSRLDLRIEVLFID